MSDAWAEWEPPEWVAARGPYLTIASEHFAVRLEADGAERERITRAAPSLLAWLEAAYAVLCDPASAQFFVRPYATVGWSTLAPPRKLNVYCGTKAHPQTGWACQGTHVERVTHLRGAGNPEGKLHHSFLALSPGAAESQRTAVHEFAHCLQMHTGGHVDTDKVGYQWEAHAEYCTQLVNHAWAPHVRAYLETSYLPIDLTNYDRDGEGGGRQYIVWPFYAFLDRRFGARFVHSLWRSDWEQRRRSGGPSRDMLTNLLALGLLRERGVGDDGAALAALFAEYARQLLTLDLGQTAAQTAALIAAESPLLKSRFTPLRRAVGGDADAGAGWRPDGSRLLRRCGVCCHWLRVAPEAAAGGGGASGGGEASVRLVPRADDGHLWALSVVGYDHANGERHYVGGDAAAAAADAAAARGRDGVALCARWTPRRGCEYLSLIHI